MISESVYEEFAVSGQSYRNFVDQYNKFHPESPITASTLYRGFKRRRQALVEFPDEETVGVLNFDRTHIAAKPGESEELEPAASDIKTENTRTQTTLHIFTPNGCRIAYFTKDPALECAKILSLMKGAGK